VIFLYIFVFLFPSKNRHFKPCLCPAIVDVLLRLPGFTPILKRSILASPPSSAFSKPILNPTSKLVRTSLIVIFGGASDTCLFCVEDQKLASSGCLPGLIPIPHMYGKKELGLSILCVDTCWTSKSSQAVRASRFFLSTLRPSLNNYCALQYPLFRAVFSSSTHQSPVKIRPPPIGSN